MGLLPPCPAPVPLPRTQNSRLCDSGCRWDRGKTNSVSGCKMSSKNFCRSRSRSCWRSKAARGFGSISTPGRARRAVNWRGVCWGPGLGEPPCSQDPSSGASGCSLDTPGLDSLFPFPETKSHYHKVQVSRRGRADPSSTKGMLVPGTAREAPLYSGNTANGHISGSCPSERGWRGWLSSNGGGIFST